MPRQSTSTIQDTLDHVQRHGEYYIEGGDLFLLVDGTFFRVHSSFLIRDSPKFREELKVEPGKKRKGSEESNAIKVDTTPEAFAKFLWVYYNREYDQYRATLEEWTSILKIASAYDFPRVKAFCVQNLETCDIDVAQRIKLYGDFEVDPKYIIPWFVKLCMREAGPTDGETEIMGIKVSLIVYRARERLRSSPVPGPPPVLSEAAAIEAICCILGYNSALSVTGTSPQAGGSNNNPPKPDAGKKNGEPAKKLQPGGNNSSKPNKS